MSYSPTEPVPGRWLGPVDDVIPDSLIAAYDLPSYPEGPTGDLREIDVAGASGRKVGTLWTNDRDGCDLDCAKHCDSLDKTQLVLILRKLRAAGKTATEAFDTIANSDRRLGTVRESKVGANRKAPTPGGAGASG
ncbi:hypothetical protein SEA_MORGANA_143 [Gordonia phage Morgana]|uniref:Uncharacterized protein n=1 Tax=Gordonia phage Morgana TaxID=3137292 RepID=A0AAX4RC20_9CAUD